MKESLYLFLENGILEWNKTFANESVKVEIQKRALHYYEIVKVNINASAKEFEEKKVLFTSKIKGTQCEFEFFFNPDTEKELYKEFMCSYLTNSGMPLKLVLDSKAEIGSFFRDFIWCVSPGV